jgi:type I restriction enzyme, S subunit
MSWDEKHLGEISELITKGTTPTTYGFPFIEDGVNFIKAESYTDDGAFLPDKFAFISEEANAYIKRSILREGDILFSIAGVLGRVSIVKKEILPANTNQAVAIIRLKNGYDNIFIKYFLQHPQVRSLVNSIRIQGAQPNINLTQLSKLRINLPPLPIQKKISAILSTYDDLIENNLKRIKLLEEAAQNIYKEWFVNMRFPGYENGAGNEETGLPEGWVKNDFESVCDASGGGTPSTKNSSYWEEGEIIWFSPTDLSNNNSIMLLDSNKKISMAGLENSSAKLLPPRTILMSSRATIGLFGLISKECSTNQGFINLIPKKEKYRYFLLYNLISRKSELIANASGTTFKELSKKTFKKMKIVLPTEDLLYKFYDILENVIDSIENIEGQNQLLKEARDILLPRLMNQNIEI